jgi:hypothetical protein
MEMVCTLPGPFLPSPIAWPVVVFSSPGEERDVIENVE